MAEHSLVFNIQHYSLHDGPGIRTIVFVKGCPLRCRWCCNPESQSFLPEFFYSGDRCIGKEECGLCGRACSSGAVSFRNRALIDRNRCTRCMKCADVCPSCAIRIAGVSYSLKELTDMIEKDAVFYAHGNGGLTVSGGEPLVHGELLIPLLKEAKKRKINTAIETCGCGDYRVLSKAVKYLDSIMFDIKTMNEEKHIEYTGQSNRRILDNFRNLAAEHTDIPIKVRTPVVPGFNDSISDIKDILDFISPYENVTYEPLRYHSLGRGKYVSLGREYPMGNLKLDEEKFREICRFASQHGQTVRQRESVRQTESGREDG